MSEEQKKQIQGRELLRVESLSVSFACPEGGEKTVVNGSSFFLQEGEILGIAGESGSGKSMTALALMGLLPEGARRSCEEIFFDGKKLCGKTGSGREKRAGTAAKKKREEEQIRQAVSGKEMAMIFQEPLTSLNPVQTIRKQVEEPLLLHTGMNARERKMAVTAALLQAGLKHPERLLSQYPHQLSGGMRQRVMIAMAMINHPRLLIADEPTTALDAVTEREIVSLIRRLSKEQKMAVIFISHDLGVLRAICDRVMVMKDGQIVESGETAQIFEAPLHEYTKKLIAATVKGQKEPVNDEGAVAGGAGGKSGNAEPVLMAERVSVVYRRRDGLFCAPELKQAVSEVSFSVRRGEIFGIVGESGCGKSTLLKVIAGLLLHCGGEIHREAGVQMVFQDPYTSLNPAKCVGWILEEPLRLNTKLTKEERMERVREMIKETELPEDVIGRHVAELSGGQRQRVAIAAALITNPSLVLLDEPVSALDVTVQAQIIELLLRLQREHGLTYVFVSHDMAVVRKLCDRVMVMKDGRVVECGDANELFLHPKAEYTKKLLGDKILGKSMNVNRTPFIKK